MSKRPERKVKLMSGAEEMQERSEGEDEACLEVGPPLHCFR